MKYTFACKRVPLNDSIKEYAQKKISKLERYFREEDTTAFVTFSVEKDHLCSVEITIRGGATENNINFFVLFMAVKERCGLTEICAAPLTPLWDISSGRF